MREVFVCFFQIFRQGFRFFSPKKLRHGEVRVEGSPRENQDAGVRRPERAAREPGGGPLEGGRSRLPRARRDDRRYAGHLCKRRGDHDEGDKVARLENTRPRRLNLRQDFLGRGRPRRRHRGGP